MNKIIVDFPYHSPSMVSSLSDKVIAMPDSIGYVLLQVYYHCFLYIQIIFLIQLFNNIYYYIYNYNAYMFTKNFLFYYKMIVLGE